MPSINLAQSITAWSSIAENVFVPHTEEEYDRDCRNARSPLDTLRF